jgi:uncharacterized membrane protein YfcA
MKLIKTTLIGFGAGIASGLLGIGGAIIMVPGMVYTLGLSQHMANATSLAVVIPSAFMSAAVYQSFGQLDTGLAALFAIGGMAGAYLGSALLPKVQPEHLRRIFGVLTFALAVRMWFS